MNREPVTITVNGRPVEVPLGTSLLDALRSNGVQVPTLCHDDRLTPYGGCRLCVVQRRDGRGGLVPACSTPVEAGMVIDTDTPEVVSSRTRQLQFLVLNHRMECPVCERRGDCDFQDLIFRYGALEEQLPFTRVPWPRDEGSPLIVRDNEKCILCGKCARLCEEVQGVAAIGIVNRGLAAHVATWLDEPLDCEFCGQCVDACPVAALVARPFVADVPVWQRTVTTTTCSYCSCGCQLEIESFGGKLLRVRSSQSSQPNRGKLCAKGRFGWDVLGSEERITRPLVRRDGRLVEASWDEAFARVTSAVRESRDKGRAIVGLATPRLGLEDAYLFQRLLRGVIGTPHVDCGPGRGVRALAEGVMPVLGAPRSTATFADLASADTVLVLRADPARTHPLVKTELVEGIRKRGQKLILAHSLSGEMDPLAELYLPVAPGGEATLLDAVARALAGDPELEKAARSVEGFAEWRSSLDGLPAERVAAAGVSPEHIATMAWLLRQSSRLVVAVVSGHGIPGDEIAVAQAAAELLVLLGRHGSPGSGLLVLGEKADAQGVVDAGLHPALLPGGVSLADDAERGAWGALWGTQVPAGPGWSAREALERAAAGEVGVLYLVGRDPVDAWSRSFSVRPAIEGARTVVVQDAFLTETARAADVVLPVAILIERSGSLVGADGIRRPMRRAVTPPGGGPGDGEVFVEVACRLGGALPVGPALEEEVAALIAKAERRSAARFPTPRYTVAPASGAGLMLDASPQLFHSGSTT
ncbi:MAG: molybdopterin-dependent oxidoreductase, partial [Acidobacteriota bacterium]